jgi:hypothetical protein
VSKSKTRRLKVHKVSFDDVPDPKVVRAIERMVIRNALENGLPTLLYSLGLRLSRVPPDGLTIDIAGVATPVRDADLAEASVRLASIAVSEMAQRVLKEAPPAPDDRNGGGVSRRRRGLNKRSTG